MERIESKVRLNSRWMNRVNRKVTAGLLIVLGVVLISLIVSSSKLAVVSGQRNALSETEFSIIKNHLEDTANYLAELSAGPNGPVDDQLKELEVISQEALLLKHSGVYDIYDDASGFSKAGFQFSEALSELQLVSYNLQQKMSKYHYQPSEQDKKQAKALANSVHELAQQVEGLQDVAFATSGAAQATIKDYQAKADIVTKRAKDFVAVLLKE